jgi:hypothetical protein
MSSAAATPALEIAPGSDTWKKMRGAILSPRPGTSPLYYLNDVILGRRTLIPMTYRAHLALCMFAESRTGIPEIDSARIKLILVPRGMGKSSLVTKALPILRILQNRNFATGIANEKQDLANTFLGDIKSEFESNQLLRVLFPECIPDDIRGTIWAADRIITKRDKQNPTSPSILATGVGATVTGVHMDAWLIDDLISQNAAEAAFRGNFSEIEAADRWMGRLQPLLKSPKRDPIIVIGTRWWEGDTYERIIRRWSHDEPKQEFRWTLKYPAQRYEWNDGGETKLVDIPAGSQTIPVWRAGEIAVFKRPAIDDNGRPIFPERYDLEELEMLAQEDPVFYAGQYLLEPTAGAASTFDAEWLKFYEWEGLQIRYRNQNGEIRYQPIRELTTFISVDPAFSKKHTSARSAIPVIGMNGKEIFLLEDFADRLDSEDDIAAKVVDFFLKYRPQKIFVETIVAQVAVANAIRRRFREEGLGEPPLEEIRSHGQQKKHMRIYGMEHYFKRGIFYLNRSHQKFLHEYQTFPRGELRDILDAISFQKDEWEKVFMMGHYNKASLDPNLRRVQEQSAIQRVRDAFKPRRR